MHRLFVLLLVLAGANAGSASGEILKREPPMGALKENEKVLVDDGSCPRGQIKEVVGGNHVKAGGYKHVERQRRCVPR
jgi:hypothetical protein